MSKAERLHDLRTRAGSETMRGQMEVGARRNAYRAILPDLRAAERAHHEAVEKLRADSSIQNLSAFIQTRKNLRALQEKARLCWA